MWPLRQEIYPAQPIHPFRALRSFRVIPRPAVPALPGIRASRSRLAYSDATRLFTAPLVRPELVMRQAGLTGFVWSALILSTTSTSAQRAVTMAGRSPVYAPNGVAATSQPLA